MYAKLATETTAYNAARLQQTAQLLQWKYGAPAFKPSPAAYCPPEQYRIRAPASFNPVVGAKPIAEEIVMGESHDTNAMPEYRASPPPEDKSARMRNRQVIAEQLDKDGNWVVEASIEVNTQLYDRARVEVKYWPDRDDPDGWAGQVELVPD